MPNGDMTPEAFARLEEYFAPLAACLEDFAARHHLLVDRYYHDSPSWALCFAHPRGGSAKIDVVRAAEGALEVHSIWWLDVYREFTRYLRDGTLRPCEVSAAALEPVLAEALAEILSWTPGDWTRTARGYGNVWGRFSEEEFARLSPRYPRAVP